MYLSHKWPLCIVSHYNHVYQLCAAYGTMCFTVDGHHKLIRWKMVTHAGIDGFSRMITFMKCFTNNEATTVYNLFLDAVSLYGLPSRVRTDYGGENRLVAQHMLENHGTHRSSVMTGNSVHNQRIKRSWRDMHECVSKLFTDYFIFLKNKLKVC